MELCPSNHRISSEIIRGGMDIWWNKNIKHAAPVVKTQALDERGNLTRAITRHEGQFQKNVS
ncbi:MAG: hypothetical protein M2R45_04121 [Verrucomicrobia subdivision 3 bacterium]|nr:hypothetical protein [Limisphaerales bacterium]MCS1417076.1 hypothetical protein [Limisphaerales bacterium]